ncbi:MAG: uncharacterized protein PWP46_236 [Fusobacteriaceae bacterium]|jgi:predicted GNAT family acetyltransferase|nr:Acetyltransferase [Fusobacteriales bacterium]MDN5303357.1 uncharacterized protein [Fusobacteriaceae bacterium]
MVKAIEKDLNDLLQFLSKEKIFNIFFIGDIELEGISSENLDIYLRKENDTINGALLRYYNSYIIYDISENLTEKEIKNYLKHINFSNNIQISGIKRVISQLLNYIDLTKFNYREMYFSKYFENNFNIDINLEIKYLNLNEIDKYLEFRNQITEFEMPINPDSLKNELKNNKKRVTYIEKNGKIIASASTTAETKDLALIVGVATLKEERKNGYASKCVKQLCDDLIKEEKEIALFYDNPKAGSIYKKIGFKEIGMWSLLIKNS